MARYHGNENFPIIIQWGFFAFLTPSPAKHMNVRDIKFHLTHAGMVVKQYRKFDLDSFYVTLKHVGASRIWIFAISPPFWKIIRWDFHTIFLGHIAFICVAVIFLYLLPFDLEVKTKFTNIAQMLLFSTIAFLWHSNLLDMRFYATRS